jgi:hypothetical protein
VSAEDIIDLIFKNRGTSLGDGDRDRFVDIVETEARTRDDHSL